MHKDLINNMNIEDTYISQLFEYYQSCFKNKIWCEEFVRESRRIPEEHRANHCIGLCDRSIGTIVPDTRNLLGGAIRGGLQHVGLITSTGGELFRGCLVFPQFDVDGKIVAALGYRFGKRIRKGQPKVIYWQKPEPNDYQQLGKTLAKELIHA